MINLPERCLRDRHDCQPLAQIKSDHEELSFICVGENDGSNRVVPQDKFTMCWKNEGIDECSHLDKRDLTDTASIILQALSIAENEEYNGNEIESIGAHN